MRVSSNGDGSEVECTECNPPRRFKSKSGLNGHTQFKHGRLPDNRAVVPSGKQSRMYEDLTERVDRGFDRVIDRLDSLANGNGNGQGNGNGNGLANGNGYNTEPIGVVSPPKDEPAEQTYFCEGCNAHGLKPGQERCGGCGTDCDWSGVAVPLDLTKSEL